MTIDAVRAGLTVRRLHLELAHRATGRDLGGFLHRGRQLVRHPARLRPAGRRTTAGCGCRSSAGRRRWRSRACSRLSRSASPTTSGAGRSAASARTCAAGATTGVLKLVGIPAYALWRTRSLSGALLVGLAANVLNQLDTRPGRALKAYLVARPPLGGRPTRVAVLLAPYDLREMTMLGDAGSNALGAVLGLRSVGRLTERHAGARSRRSPASPSSASAGRWAR